MPDDRIKARPQDALHPSRRDILRASAVAALATLTPPVIGSARAQPASQPADRPAAATRPTACEPPWWIAADGPAATVVEVSSPAVLTPGGADASVLAQLLATGVQALTGEATEDGAWRRLLGPAKRVLLKFNRVGADVIGTNVPVARCLAEALHHAGYAAGALAAVELPGGALADVANRAVTDGWGAPIAIGSASDEVANYWYDADAVVNVGVLKTHTIARMSGAMKNISHAIIRHPAQFHGTACSPHVAQIIANKEVSTRLRLNIVTALRMVLRNGPDARREDVGELGRLLLALDPVAIDSVGHDLLQAVRQERGLGEPFTVPYLDEAGAMGLGRRGMHEIRRIPIRHGS